MKLHIDQPSWTGIMAHLLPSAVCAEAAVFLFGRYQSRDQSIQTTGYHLCSPSEFSAQFSDYLELTDEGRARLIKRAHDQNACLIEMHSHPFSDHAVFSSVDISGLRETVPHMLWRLPGRPYAAIVVGRRSFDALVWTSDARQAERLTSVVAGSRFLRPTNSSMRLWQ